MWGCYLHGLIFVNPCLVNRETKSRFSCLWHNYRNIISILRHLIRWCHGFIVDNTIHLCCVTVRRLVEHELLTFPGFNTGLLCGVHVVQSWGGINMDRWLITKKKEKENNVSQKTHSND